MIMGMRGRKDDSGAWVCADCKEGVIHISRAPSGSGADFKSVTRKKFKSFKIDWIEDWIETAGEACKSEQQRPSNL